MDMLDLKWRCRTKQHLYNQLWTYMQPPVNEYDKQHTTALQMLLNAIDSLQSHSPPHNWIAAPILPRNDMPISRVVDPFPQHQRLKIWGATVPFTDEANTGTPGDRTANETTCRFLNPVRKVKVNCVCWVNNPIPSITKRLLNVAKCLKWAEICRNIRKSPHTPWLLVGVLFGWWD